MHLCEKGKWTSWTFNRYRKNLKVFCDYLVNEGYLDSNPVSSIKKRKEDKPLPKYFTRKQIDLIFRAVNHLYPGDDYLAVRNRTIIYTYAYTGMRLYELINLSADSVNFYESNIRIDRAKGGKDRIIPILDRLYPILKTYATLRDKQYFKSDSFFPTFFGNPLQHREVYGIINRLKEKLDFPITCHMFRHTFATELASKNVNLYNIASLLGHSNLQTTRIYLNFCLDNVRDSLNNASLYR
ncbi:MAG TPA: tyrosine-type recombinase/integrase [bacterium]|nr:tyrosine-type recombinase/integrase [bacterium]